MSQNRLADESSPYLLQHRDNPVHWQAWAPETLRFAQENNKPILLSVGYSACHWCHVMAHESFEDDETAALMNDLYVNIKVDREERPDLDTIYQRALALMGQQGGWPLTMFMTPNGEPFWGGTYFPPEPRFGRPGFRDVLRLVHESYRNEPDKIEKNRTAMADALGKLADNKPGGEITKKQTEEMAQMLLREVDPRHGGVGGAPKFPQCGILEMLWRNYLGTGSELMRTAVLLTMERMSQGGIYDHLGGGYARYSTDERWLAPHFEKMLYDNAQILEFLCHAWQDSGDELFRRRAEETVDWLLREMITGEGAFASALDADSEGEEGRFYVWSEQEIDDLLGADAAYFKTIYDVSAPGNWEGKNILNRLRRPRNDESADEARLQPLRDVLLKARARRIRPSWDDKVLADWNGLMIAAIAFASAVFERPAWLAAAGRAYDYVSGDMAAGEGLRHAARGGQVKDVVFLDDYAEMARAALCMSEVTGEARYLADARRWTAQADGHFWDPATGGYFYSPDTGEKLISRTKTAHDAATPAGNGTLVGVLARLHALTGEQAYATRAHDLIQAFSGELEGNFSPISTLINNSATLRRPMQIVIIGTRGEADTDALIRAVFHVSLPDRILSVLTDTAALPENHPASGKTRQDGRASAYVCIGPVCSLPFTDAAGLKEHLRGAQGDADT